MLDRIPGFAKALQFEDGLLFILLVIIEPLLQKLLGSGLEGMNLGNLTSEMPNGRLVGGFFLLATICGFVCLITRTAGEKDNSDAYLLRVLAYFALGFVFCLLFIFGLELLGRTPGHFSACFPCAILIFFLGIYVIVRSYAHLPQLDAFIRRVLMTPLILFSTWIFSVTVQANSGGLSVTAIFLTLAFYVVFIIAPRQAASGGGAWSDWLIRFIIYLIGFGVNTALMQSQRLLLF